MLGLGRILIAVVLLSVLSLSSYAKKQIGSDIDGEATLDESGRSVSLSSDGTVMAVGAYKNNSGAGHVRVYEWDGKSWLQRGSDIDGEAAGDRSGCAVS